MSQVGSLRPSRLCPQSDTNGHAPTLEPTHTQKRLPGSSVPLLLTTAVLAE